jgi:hypothetical protein
MADCRRSLTAVLLVALFPAAAGAQTAAGRIKSASGAVFVVRKNVAAAAQSGQTLLEADTLRTGPDGRAGVTLRDETRIAIGPNSEVRLDQFLYSPGQGRLGFAMRIARGIVAYVSGRIAKLAPESVRLETPSAILGVRGTTMVIRVENP